MKKKGFSLLEVIIASALVVVLTGSVVLVFLTCLKAWNAGIDRAMLRTKMAQALDGISRDLYKASAISVDPGHDNMTFTVDTTVYHLDLVGAEGFFNLIESLNGGAGVTLVEGVHPTESGVYSNVFDVSGHVVTIDLTATENKSTVRMRTKVMARNL